MGNSKVTVELGIEVLNPNNTGIHMEDLNAIRIIFAHKGDDRLRTIESGTGAATPCTLVSEGSNSCIYRCRIDNPVLQYNDEDGYAHVQPLTVVDLYTIEPMEACVASTSIHNLDTTMHVAWFTINETDYTGERHSLYLSKYNCEKFSVYLWDRKGIKSSNFDSEVKS